MNATAAGILARGVHRRRRAPRPRLDRLRLRRPGRPPLRRVRPGRPALGLRANEARRRARGAGRRGPARRRAQLVAVRCRRAQLPGDDAPARRRRSGATVAERGVGRHRPDRLPDVHRAPGRGPRRSGRAAGRRFVRRTVRPAGSTTAPGPGSARGTSSRSRSSPRRGRLPGDRRRAARRWRARRRGRPGVCSASERPDALVLPGVGGRSRRVPRRDRTDRSVTRRRAGRGAGGGAVKLLVCGGGGLHRLELRARAAALDRR